MDTIGQMFAFLSLSYILSLIIASYFAITTIQMFVKTKIKTMYKRIITLMVGLVLGGCYKVLDLVTMDSLIPSFFVAIIGYDYFIKELLAKVQSKVSKKSDNS